MKSYTIAATILLLTSSTMHTDAFSSWIKRYPQHQHQRLGGGFAVVGGTHFRQLVSDRYRPLFASEEKEEENVDVDVDVEATVPESEVEEEEESSEEVSEDKEEEEDPELKALKEEISKLETELKSKRFVLNDVRERADVYTESGYLRQVAEMDNYRKKREITTQNNRYSARATVVAQLLPILDELEELEAKYDREINGYKALRWDLQNVLTEKLDVEEFTVETGSEFSFARHKIVGEEESAEFAKDTIIREVKKGLEIKGNVLRPAEVIKSLGNGNEEEAEQSEESTDNEDSSSDE